MTLSEEIYGKMKPETKKIKTDPDDIGDARIRLRGALNDSIHLEDDYDSELPQRGRPSKKLLLAQRETQRLLATLPPANNSGSMPESNRSKKYNTISKKRAVLSALQKPHNESFVMKLFDRSLDLSKYTEKTPLYRICRAWMANQPRNPNITNFSKEEPQPIKRDDNAQEILEKLKRHEIKVVTQMPLPRETQMSAIPTALVEKMEGQGESRKLLEGTKEELLADHKKHWAKVRSHWIAHTRKYNEERYGAIFRIMDKLNHGGETEK